MRANRMGWWGIFFLFLASQTAWAGTLSVSDAWVREAPPAAKALAAYMVITNTGKETVHLKGADCRDFATVELHQSMMHQGMMHMMGVESLEIPPGQAVHLKPGGYHLMLMEPERQLRAGDQVQLQLYFASGEQLPVDAVVQKGPRK